MWIGFWSGIAFGERNCLLHRSVDMVLRLTIIPSSIVGVLFPAFAMSLNQDPTRAAALLSRGLKYVFLVVFQLS